METHVRVLAALRIIFGALGMLAAIVVLLFFGGLAGLVGMTDRSPGAEVAVPILGGIGGVIFLIVGVISLPGLIAGIGLLRYRPWARILTLVLSVIDLVNFPFGTVLGIYGFWVLLSNQSQRLFAQPSLLPPP